MTINTKSYSRRISDTKKNRDFQSRKQNCRTRRASRISHERSIEKPRYREPVVLDYKLDEQMEEIKDAMLKSLADLFSK